MIYKKKIMKRFIGLAAFVSLITMISSCKKDVSLLPLSAVDISVYFRSSKDITASLAGMYTSFQEEMTGVGTGTDASDKTEAYGGRYNYWGDCRSDNFDRSQYVNTTETEIAFNAITINNPATDWGGLYRTIYRANVNIKFIPQVPQYDPLATTAIVNNALAQSYAMRAECYFYIVRLWGDGPIWTTPYLDATQPAARVRSPKAKIIDSVIIPDLTKAYALMPKGLTPVVWNINEAAICAMMADVYMWRAGQPGGGQSDYQNAIAWIQKIFLAKNPKGSAYLATGGLEPKGTWKNLFLAPTTSVEPIWSINWDYTVNGCACIPITTQLSNNPVRVDSGVYFNWKANNKTDIRFGQTVDTTSVAATQSTWLAHMDKVLKYFPTNYNAGTILTATGTTVTALNLNVYQVMYRLGDVYLSYAEALNQTGDLNDALTYLNAIHTRAGFAAYLPTQFTTMSAMQAAILQERQYELFAEGKRWFDLVRTGYVQQIMNPIVSRRQRTFGTAQTGFQDLNKVLWPLSLNALNANRLLVQNPSYF
jgi:hypothetical protein